MEEVKERNIGVKTAVFLVVSTMIGTGVFTTTGFMIKDLNSPFAIIFSWFLGGVLALCGALSYSELVAMMPRNGGEYNVLSKVYNNTIGFICAFVSLIVGFAASIASSALAFGTYLNTIFPINPTLAGIVLVLSISIIHTQKSEIGVKFQDYSTLIKIILIICFILSGLFFGHFNYIPITKTDFNIIISPTFAIGLIYVSFAYSGWEAAGYIAGEIKDPEKNLHKSLILGTIIVTLLYLGLNFVYLYMIPYQNLSGVAEIGQITAKNLFGEAGGVLMSGLISFGLLSAVGSMSMAGSRMYEVIGEDYNKLSFFAKKNKNGIPAISIYIQTIIVLLMIFSASFDTLLQYIGFTLSIFSSLAILGVIIMRIKKPEMHRPYKTFGYPLTPLLFIFLSAWMILHSIIEEPKVCLTGFGTILVGYIIYLFVKEK